MSGVKVFVDTNFINKSYEKKDLFIELSENIEKRLNSKVSKQKVYDALIKRELESTTGFENSFAIPHGAVDSIENPYIFFFRLNNEVEWQALDNKKIKCVFLLLIASGGKNNKEHLKVLSKLSYNLLDKDFQKDIKNSKDDSSIKLSIEKIIK